MTKKDLNTEATSISDPATSSAQQALDMASQQLAEENSSLAPESSRRSSDPVLRIPPVEKPFDPSAHKFDLEPNPSAQGATPEVEPPAYEYLGELPHSYGTKKLYLTARDPYWLYCYWDMDHDQLRAGEQASHDGKIFLQLYRADGTRVDQIHVSPWSKEWYLNGNGPDTTFYAELGYYRPDGGFEVMTRSPEITTPRDTLSWKTDAQFVTIPFEFSFRQLLEMIRDNMQNGEELAEALARLQQEGFPFPFKIGTRTSLPGGGYSSEELLGLMGGGDIIRRIQSGSGEIVEILRKQWSPAESSGQWISSISSPFGSSFGAPAPRDFFMNVNAELIIYGGTHPDAKVRIDGKNIKLKSDGTFYYHFNLADGKFHIPIEATSPDEVETRSALLSFLRMSAYTDGVDKTPQPERDQPFGRVE